MTCIHYYKLLIWGNPLFWKVKYISLQNFFFNRLERHQIEIFAPLDPSAPRPPHTRTHTHFPLIGFVRSVIFSQGPKIVCTLPWPLEIFYFFILYGFKYWAQNIPERLIQISTHGLRYQRHKHTCNI